MAKKRVTNHNGRVSKKTGKPYNPKHNDRNFDKENAENLLDNPERKNIDHQWLDVLDPDEKSKLFSLLKIDKETLTNEEAESLFYQLYYRKWLNDQNEKHLKSRHTERIKNMDQVRENKNYCPEEEILKIGKMKDVQVDPDIYNKCVDEYISFLMEKYGKHLHILDWSTHFDEPGGVHTHIRWVWDYTDEKDGLLKIGQDKALEQLGFDLPIPEGTILTDESGNTLYEKDKEGNLKKDENGEPIPQRAKKSRFNNRKMPFSAQNREKWLDICEAHGIEVERIADKKAKRGQELYEMNQENQNIEKENERLTEANKSLTEVNKNLKAEEEDLSGKVNKLEQREKDLRQSVQTLEKQALEQVKKKKPGKEKGEEEKILTEKDINAIKTEPHVPLFGKPSKILVEGEDYKNLKNTALLMRKTLQSIVEPLQAQINKLTDMVKRLNGSIAQKDEIITQKDKDIQSLNNRISVINSHSMEDRRRAQNYQDYTDYCKTLCRQHGISVPTINDFLRGSSSRNRGTERE